MPDSISQTNNESHRFEIEKRIASSARKLEWNPNENCYDHEILSQFLNGWDDLLGYYKSHQDISIGIDVVREYLYWTEKFLDKKLDQKTESNCKERVAEAGATL